MRGDALERVLRLFPQHKRQKSGDGWQVCCPAHKDEKPSMHIKQGVKGVVLTCYSGCAPEDIVRELGLEMKDLFDDDVQGPRPPRSKSADKPETVSVRTLARRFMLDESYLRDDVGLRQVGAAVAIPYRNEEGEELYVRRRVAMSGARKVMHPKGKGLMLYGLDRLPSFRKAGKPALLFVEGESDCWVLWHHGVSALGVPGASAVKVVEARHLDGIHQVFILQEKGAAGETFQLKLGERLQSLGFKGQVRVVSLRGADDPAELWTKDPDRFPATFRQALRSAVEWSPVSLDDMVVRMDSVKRREVEFLWNPYIPLRMLTILAGKPGLGKSFLVCKLAAAISSGQPFPGNASTFRPRNVLLFAAEDDPEYVLRGRLEDNGADLSKVFAFDLVNHPFSFGGASFGKLESLIERFQPGLVVFDPIVSFTGQKVNINRQNEVRSTLQPIIDVAARTGTTVLLVAHVGKGTSSSAAIDGIMGSVDFVAAPRSGLIVYPDPNAGPDEQCGVLAHAKHNLSRSGSSLRYQIDDGVFRWRGETRMSAAELMSASTAGHEKNALDEAKEFLRHELMGEERSAKEMHTKSRALGISSSTLGRARMALGVLVSRRGFGKEGEYWWRLPQGEGLDPREQQDIDYPEDDDELNSPEVPI